MVDIMDHYVKLSLPCKFFIGDDMSEPIPPGALRNYPEGNHFEVKEPSCGDSAPAASTGNQVKGGGLRHNSGKLRVDLVPVSAITALAEVLEAGAKKYADNNWRMGMKWSNTYASLHRHLLKWLDGEDKDPETGLSHMSHVLCNAAFLIEYEQTCPELDDRYKKRAP